MADGDAASHNRAWGVGLALFSSLCFGGSGTFGKALIHAGITPLQAVWLRVAGAALLLVPLAVMSGRLPHLWAARRMVRPLLAYAAAGIVGTQAFYYLAASRLPVGVAILLEFTGPVLVLFWIRFVRRTPLHPLAAVGVAVALSGLACVVEIWSGMHFDLPGLAAALCAAACQAAYFLLIETMMGEIDPLALTAAGSTVAVVPLTVIAAPWSLPWRVLPSSVDFGGRPVPVWVIAGLLVVVSTVIAYVTGVAAVHRLSAQVAGAVCYTEAVAAILLAWLLLGERLSTAQLAGGAVVLLGAYIAQRAVTGVAAEPVPASAGTSAPSAPEIVESMQN